MFFCTFDIFQVSMKHLVLVNLLFLSIYYGISKDQVKCQSVIEESPWGTSIPNWEDYKMAYGKMYNNAKDEREHEMAFLKAKERIHEHNLAFQRGETSYAMGYSSLTDLTEDQWKQRSNCINKKSNGMQIDEKRIQMFKDLKITANGDLPELVDWRNGYDDIPVVTAVKDQGGCGSCWAFSTTGVLEATNALQTGKLVALSEQNLVDCDHYAAMGCDGTPSTLLTAYFVIDQGGLNTEEAYPYTGNDSKCQFNHSKPMAATDEHKVVLISDGDEQELKMAVANYGPISIEIHAPGARTAPDDLENYKHGVFNEPDCPGNVTTLNHAVPLIGYGTDPKYGDYWLVKNSWGKDWGEAGYVRMARNKQNQCGIATQAFFVKWWK